MYDRDLRHYRDLRPDEEPALLTPAPAAWPKVGDPALGYDDAPDCPAMDVQDGYPFACTRDAGHPMPHVADGLDQVVHVWTDANGGA